MMRRLFRSFERAGLEYLLISGQASILYGAATFSEDVDLWIRPTLPNAGRLRAALASCGARVHKLTPPLTLEHMRRGHGFHFKIPDRPAPVYLDVMAVPPRVGAFGPAFRRSVRMPTPWGRIPVVSIEDLIALKRTRRLADYEVISNLVSVKLASVAGPSEALLRWASANTFRPEDLVSYEARRGRTLALDAARKLTLRRLQAFQAADTAYWRRIVGELRRLRREGRLWPERAPVRPA
jgi:hypothetical protein